MGLPPLFLISDAARVGEDRFLSVLEQSIRAGLRMVQIREPTWSAAEVRRLALRVQAALRDLAVDGVLVVMSRRPELACELRLDGVHVGGGDPEAIVRCRALVGSRRLVGYSAHSAPEILEAAQRGADYVTLSPVFSPISKSYALPPLGLHSFSRAALSSPIPVYALGGIRPEHAARLRRAGAAGAAAIGAILDAPDAGGATKAFLEAWRDAASPRAQK